MKNVLRIFLLAFIAAVFVGCAPHMFVDESGRQVTRTYAPMGGTHVVVINHLEGVRMEAEILSPRFSGDRRDHAPAITGEDMRFFFANHFLHPRHEVVIILTFTSAEGVYVGMKEIKVRLRTRQGEYKTEVVKITRLDTPRRVRARR